MVNTDCYFIIIIIMLMLGFGEHNRKKAFSRDLQAVTSSSINNLISLISDLLNWLRALGYKDFTKP